MRRLVPAVVLSLAVALVGASAAVPAVTFVFKGHGWGHAIGLSQYGAQGYATRENRSYRWILRHFYPGTTIAERSARIGVLLASGRKTVTIGSASSFKAGSRTLSAGTWTARAGSGGRLELVKGGATRRFSSPTTFRRGSALLRLDGAPYRGTIAIRRSTSRLSAVNWLGLDDYVKGVVPQEMPSSWHQQALRAQAVAARSYALAAGGHCRWGSRSVMCKDVSDQVYGGRGAEAASTNAAVRATAGEVLVHEGSVATTFFFSTSGGKTAAKHHEWGGSPISYLRSVPDPYDRISPHHSWGPLDAEVDCASPGRDCVWSGRALRRQLGSLAPAGLRDVAVVARNGSSRVETVRATGSRRATTMTGAGVQVRLGLRSTWFSVGVLRLTGGGTIDAGAKRTLRALARNVGNAKLQRRRSDGTWATVRSVRGSERVTVRPSATTRYRLASRLATTASIRVAVRARPRFLASQTGDGLAGVAERELAGETVVVERQERDGSWTAVAAAEVQPDGRWRTSFGVEPGVYRARTPDAALAAGVSPALRVAIPAPNWR